MAQSPIDAGKIPVPDLDAATLSVDATFLNTDAGDVRSAGADVKSSWAGLSGVYSAPEDTQLFAVMDAVATKTDSFASDVETVAKALQDFATEAGPLAATLSSTKSSAAAFAKKVKDDDDWDHDQDLVDENNGYVHTVNTTIVAFQAAERKAANTIEKLIGGHTWHTADPNSKTQDKYAYGYDSIPDNAKTPWGAKVEKKDGCLKSTVKGVGHFFVGIGAAAWGMVKGVGLLVWDATGLGGWDKFKQAWEGIGFLGTLVLAPMTGGASIGLGMAIWGPKGYTQRLVAMGKGFIDWNDWKTDPAKAAGEVVFNVGSLLIPVGGEAAATADGLRGAEMAADASRGAELAGDAGKASKLLNAAKTGAKVFAKYTDPFTYVGKLPKVLDIANGLKTKFGDLTGFTKTGASDIDKSMSAWAHDTHTGEPAHTGTGDHGGAGDRGGAGDHGGDGSPTGSNHGGTPPDGSAHDGPGNATSHDNGTGPDHGDGSGQPHDPPNTTRDHSGNLHGSNGQFVHDPHAPVPDHSELAVKGDTTPHTISESNQAAYHTALDQRTELASQHTADLHTRNDLITKLQHEGVHIEPKDLTSTKLADTINSLRRTTTDPTALQHLKALGRAARESNESLSQLKNASEHLGMSAGQDVITSSGGHVIVGDTTAAGRPGELDLIGVSHDGHTLTVVEAKGGSSTLGARVVDGVRAEQGSGLYLNDLLHTDPRFLQYLHEHPAFAHQLVNGDVNIAYDLVRARASGTVSVTNFVIDSNDLHLSDLIPTNVGAGR